MTFDNLKVNRIIVHEVFQRQEDRAVRQPVLSDQLETLSAEAIGAFRLRMTDALAGQSQSLEMKIVKYGSDSFMHLGEQMVVADDLKFVELSKDVAVRLSEKQMARRIPGGMLIVFDGTVGGSMTPFVGVIKAEIQAGFRRSRSGEKAIVEFLQNIFLTPATRLYKIGIFLYEEKDSAAPSGRRAYIFDNNISISNREAAAAYFYEGFLGCALPSDGPYETARFFDITKEFVRRSSLTPERKRDLLDSLFVFVRDEQDSTFTYDQFCDRFIPQELRDSYGEFMRAKKFSPNAIVRDTSQMGTRLRRRRLKFGADIELSASPDALATKITVDAIQGDAVEGAVIPMWTRIIIKEPLSGEQ